jgi:hypothetical protein
MHFGVFIIVAIMLCGGTISALEGTEWEGAAAIAPGGDLPGGGYSIATNSFPVNTMVDVINLENEKTVRVSVTANLNTTELLATLSRDTAEAIGLRGDSSCRIRMSKPSHEIAVAQLKLGPVVEPSPGSLPSSPVAEPVPYSPPAILAAEPEDTLVLVPEPELVPSPLTEENTAVAIVNLPGKVVNNEMEDGFTATAPENKLYEDYESSKEPAAFVFVEPVQSPEPYLEPYIDDEPAWGTLSGIISLSPSEERLPEADSRPISPEYLAPPIGNTIYVPSAYVPPPDFSPFQAPLISRLERGMYYVQVAAYARPENVEDEISRIGQSYPLAIQNIGTDSKPLFRVLLGPLNQTEGLAMLQRFKSIGYTDAFVWRN